MYSPKLPEELVRELYQLKQRIKKPMTVMVKEAVEKYLKEYKLKIKKGGEKNE